MSVLGRVIKTQPLGTTLHFKEDMYGIVLPSPLNIPLSKRLAFGSLQAIGTNNFIKVNNLIIAISTIKPDIFDERKF